jgi:DNA invertase Pin-like site-specific DNA recombinase
MTTAAVYIRVSTSEQLGNSPESQLAEIRKFANNNDFLILDEFIFAEEEGRSGRQATKRPEFQNMIATAKQPDKPFDAILIWKFSRFARNRQDSIIYKSMLRKKLGIKVISVAEKLGTEDNIMNDLMEAIIECMDEYYSINLAEEVKRGMINKVKNGEIVFRPPYGYKIENGKAIIKSKS